MTVWIAVAILAAYFGGTCQANAMFASRYDMGGLARFHLIACVVCVIVGGFAIYKLATAG